MIIFKWFQALRSIKAVAHGIVMLTKRGWKKLGKQKLEEHAGNVEDAGFDGRLHAMLSDAELSTVWRDIPSDDSASVGATPMPEAPVFDMVNPDEHWLHAPHGWNAYYGQFAAAPAKQTDQANQV